MSTLRRTEKLLLQKKRKLDQSLESAESSVDHGQALGSHNVKKLVTTLSCVTNFRDIVGDSLHEQAVHNSCISSTGVSTSIEGSEEKRTNSCSSPSTVDLVSAIVAMEGSAHGGPREDPSDKADGSYSSDTDEESNVTTRRRVFALLYLDENYPPRATVPIGPGFQAEIPAWEGTFTKNNYNSLESTYYSDSRRKSPYGRPRAPKTITILRKARDIQATAFGHIEDRIVRDLTKFTE